MASRRSLVVAPLVCASLLFAWNARAEPTAADRETARALMQEGRDLRDKGAPKQALKRFKAADDIMHVPTTALEVARTQVSLGLLVEARDTIAEIRQQPPRPLEPAPFREARARADELDVGLEGRVPSITIAVMGAAGGDAPPAIAVDGVVVPAGAVGLPRSVDPGHHVVTVQQGATAGRAEVDVREGEKKAVEVALVGAAVAAPTPEAPAAPAAAAPAAGSEATPEEPEATRSHAPSVLTWTGIGVAGAGVVAGVVTGALSLSKKSSLDAACAGKVCGPSSYADLDAARSMATVSDVAFAVAGVGAALAVVTLVVGHTESHAPAAQPAGGSEARVVPWLGVGAAGVAGTF
jgi:hypothetical protein